MPFIFREITVAHSETNTIAYLESQPDRWHKTSTNTYGSVYESNPIFVEDSVFRLDSGCSCVVEDGKWISVNEHLPKNGEEDTNAKK